jgi:hypothetical protein
MKRSVLFAGGIAVCVLTNCVMVVSEPQSEEHDTTTITISSYRQPEMPPAPIPAAPGAAASSILAKRK